MLNVVEALTIARRIFAPGEEASNRDVEKLAKFIDEQGRIGAVRFHLAETARQILSDDVEVEPDEIEEWARMVFSFYEKQYPGAAHSVAVKSKVSKEIKVGEKVAHRRHLITRTFDGYVISKDGYYLATAPNLDRAKVMIDELLD